MNKPFHIVPQELIYDYMKRYKKSELVAMLKKITTAISIKRYINYARKRDICRLYLEKIF